MGMQDRDTLVRLAAGGDRRALDRLLTDVRSEVLRHCARVLPHPMDAEEACQDALLAISRNIGAFEGRSAFSTWMYRVTANAALDTYRRLKRQAAHRGQADMELLPTAARTSVIAGTKIDLLDALESIDERVREPIVLRDLLGMDYAEIAVLLDVPVGTIKSRIHEGRQKVQHHLGR